MICSFRFNRMDTCLVAQLRSQIISVGEGKTSSARAAEINLPVVILFLVEVRWREPPTFF